MNPQMNSTNPAPPATDLKQLIKLYEMREAELVRQMGVTDADLLTGGASPETWGKQFLVGDTVDEAALAILSYRPRNAGELHAKIEWMFGYWEHTEPESHEVHALLHSMLPEPEHGGVGSPGLQVLAGLKAAMEGGAA